MIRVCPHSDAQCRNGIGCTYSCATDEYDGNKRPMTDTYECSICAKSINEGDLCLDDIDMGACHAECLEGSPVVDRDTGEPLPDDAPKPVAYPWSDQ